MVIPLFRVLVGNDLIDCCEECFVEHLIQTGDDIGEARAATKSEEGLYIGVS